MARPEKHTVDYFPYICKEGKTMRYLERMYKNDGYAVWWKTLRQLAITTDHWLNLRNPINLMDLASICNISDELLLKIINDLVTFEEFDGELWEKYQVVWCEKFVVSIQDAYSRRSNKCFTRQDLVNLLDGKPHEPKAEPVNFELVEKLEQLRQSNSLKAAYQKNHKYTDQDYEELLSDFEKTCKEKEFEGSMKELRDYFSNFNRVWKMNRSKKNKWNSFNANEY